MCSEFIGEDGNEKFWQFVDTVKELTVYKHGGMSIFTLNYYFYLKRCNSLNWVLSFCPTTVYSTESVRSYYNLIIKKAGQFLTDLQVNLLKFALALRSYSPAVHASQQVCSDQSVIK